MIFNCREFFFICSSFARHLLVIDDPMHDKLNIGRIYQINGKLILNTSNVQFVVSSHRLLRLLSSVVFLVYAFNLFEDDISLFELQKSEIQCADASTAVQKYDERTRAQTKQYRDEISLSFCVFRDEPRTSPQLSLDTLSTHQTGISSQTYYEQFCASYFRFAFSFHGAFIVHFLRDAKIGAKNENLNAIRYGIVDARAKDGLTISRSKCAKSLSILPTIRVSLEWMMNAVQCDKTVFIEYTQSENACHLFWADISAISPN